MINKQFTKRATSGFTLVELLVVIVIVGVLSAIAAPGWLAFANSRRAIAANDQVLQVLRQAQAQATRTRRTQVVKFDVAANPPLIVYQDVSTALGEGVSQGRIGMSAIGNSAVAAEACNGDKNCIAFGANGAVLNLSDGANTTPLTITVFAPNPQATAKRCVKIESLLGAMRSAIGSDCN